MFLQARIKKAWKNIITFKKQLRNDRRNKDLDSDDIVTSSDISDNDAPLIYILCV